MSPHPNNLPLQLTSLVGRERELEALNRLLTGDVARLVTLTGPGGSGKTRLALQAAGELVGRFPDGVFFVSLAPISDPRLVLSAVAQTLEVREAGGTPLLDSLKAFLRDRKLLLVLDNFEQVLEAGPTILELLSECPSLQVMVTSRAALHVRGERESPVPPLALPERRRSDPGDLARYASVSLFVERAQAVRPDFAVSANSARDVAEICSRLDGLPLAIELAAARSKLLTPAAMLARLDRRLPLLTGGAHDLPERQRTLRGTIAWSYDLLTPEEQRLFRRLSVFVGGANLESAEAVVSNEQRATGNEGEAQFSVLNPQSFDLLEGAASLVDKNLLRQADGIGAEARFEMLETIREFGLEMLEASGDLGDVQRRHAAYFLLLAEGSEPNISGASHHEWLQRLELEHDNLRTALRWYVDHRAVDEGLRLAGALGQFWQFHGYLSEGRAWLDTVLSAADESTTPERAKALTYAGMLALFQGDFGLACTLHEQCLALYRALEDRLNMAVAINDLGTVALYQGQYTAAREWYEQSLSIREQIGDRRGEAVSLTNLGLVAQAQGDLTRARSLHEQSLAIRRELADGPGIARALSRVGIAATEQRDYAAARIYLSEALSLAQEQGDKQAVAWSLTNLGVVSGDLGHFAEAHSRMEEGLSIRRQLGDIAGTLRSLWYLARLAETRADLSLARGYREEALSIARQTADKKAIVLWLTELGDVLLRQGDYAAARQRYEESLALRLQLGDEGGAAAVRAKLAQVSHHDGDIPEARRLLEESLPPLRLLGDRQALAASLANLAQLAQAQGDLGTAEACYREAASLRCEPGSGDVTEICLRGLAAVSLARNDQVRAARLYGAAERLQEENGQPGAVDLAEAARALGLTESDAHDAPVTQAWCEGRAFTTEQALAYALDGTSAVEESETAGAFPDGLSEREVEVLRLMAAGRSNPEIAAALFISVNTVYRHTNHIFAKTGAANRVEAATYAQRHGLT